MDELIKEILIVMVQKEPIIYDKSDKNYSNNSMKDDVFNTISMAIFQLYEVHKSVNELKRMWDYLKAKFTEEYKKVCGYVASGSSGSAAQNSSTWPFYKSLEFLIPHLQHAHMITSIQEDNYENEKPPKKKFKRNAEKDYLLVEELAKRQKQMHEHHKLITNSFLKSNDVLDNYMPMIMNGLKDVTSEKKFLCTSEILNYCNAFLKNNVH